MPWNTLKGAHHRFYTWRSVYPGWEKSHIFVLRGSKGVFCNKRLCCKVEKNLRFNTSIYLTGSIWSDTLMSRMRGIIGSSIGALSSLWHFLLFFNRTHTKIKSFFVIVSLPAGGASVIIALLLLLSLPVDGDLCTTSSAGWNCCCTYCHLTVCQLCRRMIVWACFQVTHITDYVRLLNHNAVWIELIEFFNEMETSILVKDFIYYILYFRYIYVLQKLLQEVCILK